MQHKGELKDPPERATTSSFFSPSFSKTEAGIQSTTVLLLSVFIFSHCLLVPGDFWFFFSKFQWQLEVKLLPYCQLQDLNSSSTSMYFNLTNQLGLFSVRTHSSSTSRAGFMWTCRKWLLFFFSRFQQQWAHTVLHYCHLQFFNSFTSIWPNSVTFCRSSGALAEDNPYCVQAHLTPKIQFVPYHPQALYTSSTPAWLEDLYFGTVQLLMHKYKHGTTKWTWPIFKVLAGCLGTKWLNGPEVGKVTVMVTSAKEVTLFWHGWG